MCNQGHTVSIHVSLLQSPPDEDPQGVMHAQGKHIVSGKRDTSLPLSLSGQLLDTKDRNVREARQMDAERNPVLPQLQSSPGSIKTFPFLSPIGCCP